jgi:hypothetical protein
MIEIRAAPERLPDSGAVTMIEEARQALIFEVPGFARLAKKNRPMQIADGRARAALAQAIAGYRYALTGDDRVQLQPLPAGPLPVHQIKRRAILGLQRADARLEADDPGGHGVLATGSIGLKKGRSLMPQQARQVIDAALGAAVRQIRGSGRLILLRVGALRREKGRLWVDVTVRALPDGA